MNVALPAKRIFSENVEAESVDVYLERSKQDDAYIQKLLDKARPIWEKRGALCDSEGFYQHHGECWSDAIQQVMNNTDGIKEWVQAMFLQGVIPIESYHILPNTYFGRSYYLAFLTEEERIKLRAAEKKWAILYLREAQKRFLRHYITEATRRTYREETCSLEQPANVARKALQQISLESEARKRGAEGEQAALYGLISKAERNPEKIGYRATRASYETHKKLQGGEGGDIRLLLQLYQTYISRVFPDKSDVFKFEGGYNYPLVLTDQTRAVLLAIESNGAGHEMAFYQCGTSLFLYDDNFGVFPFHWKRFLLKAIKTNAQVYFTDALIHEKPSNTKFTTAFYPILCYKEGDSIQKTVLLYKNSFLEIDPNWNSKVNFELDMEDVFLKVVFAKPTAWTLTIPFFLSVSSNGDEISNTNFVLQRNSRIVTKNIKYMNKDEILSYIESAPLEELEKPIRREGEEDTYLLSQLYNSGNLEGFQALLKRGVNPNIYIENYPLLINTLGVDNVEFFNSLLAAKADLSIAEKSKGFQAIHFAVLRNRLDLLAALLQGGADVNAKTLKGITPLKMALDKNNLEAIAILCQNGATSVGLTNSIKSEEAREALEKCAAPKVSGGRKSRRKRRTGRKKTRQTKH
jgi:hypothetical protein